MRGERRPLRAHVTTGFRFQETREARYSRVFCNHFRGARCFMRHMMFLILLLVTRPVSASAQVTFTSTSLDLVEVLSIGADEEASGDYLFGRPSWVEVSENGDMYVSDPISMNIRVFDESGRFMGSIGRRGDGPGEFQAVTAFLLTPPGEVIVFDGQASRVTRFSSAGEVKATYPVDRNELPWPRRMIQVSGGTAEGQFALLGVRFVESNSAQAAQDQLIHFYSGQFGRKRSATLSYAAVYGRSVQPIHRSFTSTGPGDIVQRRKSDICHAPGLYFGQIYCIGATERRELRTVRGHSIETEPFREVNCSEPPHIGFISIMRVRPLPSLCGYIHSQSAGLVELADGQLVHFTYSSADDEAFLDYEVFDKSDRMVDNGRFDQAFPRSWHSQPLLLFSAADSDGHVYVIDHTGDTPVLRKMAVRSKRSGNTR